MPNNFDKYTLKLKSKLDKNFLSPLFIRYANLLYANELYEECIAACKTGLDIYPRYTTAKLILLKALLKSEYLNEAEILFKELKPKLTNKELVARLQSSIQSLKAISRQEKIYYHKSPRSRIDFKTFEKNFHLQENLFNEYQTEDALNDEMINRLKNDKAFVDFTVAFGEFHFDTSERKTSRSNEPEKNDFSHGITNELLGKIKIVTETLADIYAEQGNYKEALDAYNMLIRAGSQNSRRIEEKLNELERNMSRDD